MHPKSNNQMYFSLIDPLDKGHQKFLKDCFEKYIVPLYGNQEIFLRKILAAKDRQGEILFVNEEPLGLLVYKTIPSDEFACLGLPESIELKTLLIARHIKKISGYAISMLFNRSAQVAQEHLAKCIVGTISSKNPKMLKIALKLGFEIKNTFQNQSSKEPEYLIGHSSPVILFKSTQKYLET